MKKSVLILVAAILFSHIKLSAAEDITIDLARLFSKDIFELNGLPYLQPLVETMNATSNSRFFNQAFVPQKVDKPYFRFGVHSMLGFVRDDMKTYNPAMPAEQLDPNKLSNYIEFSLIPPSLKSIKDTTGLIYYALKTILYDGVADGSIIIPKEAATVLGYKQEKFHLPNDTLLALIERNPAYSLLPKEMQDSILTIIKGFPETFTLPEGANMSSLIAAVPQFEIGSFYGTELLIRFIPPVNMGKNIGDFAFWGFGLKHSISQYFLDNPNGSAKEREFDLAFQVVYQGTHLENTVGVTNAELKADATFWNFNLQASKSFDFGMDIYTGLSYETVNINSQYKYLLPQETQAQLGLLRTDKDENGHIIYIYPAEPPEYPGDTNPQLAKMKFDDQNIKFTLGVAKQIGPINIFVDYNISKFNIFTGGIEYRF
ncbi:MAG: hypothetical protein GX121_07420 [Ignavibacteria bacterium]|jgi:hypothetical protein|nr:hypothetical protein [Ignavibacteria bacterium]